MISPVLFMKIFSLLLFPSAYGIARISVQNGQFIVEGSVFVINGLAYQPRISGQIVDVVSNDMEYVWSKDIPHFKQLGVNVVRVYEIDETKKHDKFMNALAAANIYALFDLPNSNYSINRKHPSYDVDYVETLGLKVTELSQFDNTLGFFVGNEVANAPGETTKASAYVKSVMRDIRAYMRYHNLRQVPIGYAAVDDDKLRLYEAQYFTCGPQEARVDFYGINIYSWCGSSSMSTSGYEQRMQDFAGFPVPVFFSEYGCNLIRPRSFSEAPHIFGDMLKVFSGGIAYEYSEEDNNYGLVKISQNSRAPMIDFVNLKQRLSAVQIARTISREPISPSNWDTKKCPPYSDVWMVDPDVLPPARTKDTCDCLMTTLNCIVDPSISKKELGQAIDILCGTNQTDCTSIEFGQADIGHYGEWSTCTPAVKLAIVLSGFSRPVCKVDGNYAHVNANRQTRTCDTSSANSGGLNTFVVALMIISWCAIEI